MSKVIDFSRAPAMSVDTDTHCEIKAVKPENIFTFPEGILGFSNIKEYVFLLNEKVKPFMFMQSLHPSGVSFVCVETFKICKDYSIVIPEESVKALDLQSPQDAWLLSIVTVRKNVEDITANLMSPVVVNIKNSRARQVILEESVYPVRFKIWESLDAGKFMTKVG